MYFDNKQYSCLKQGITKDVLMLNNFNCQYFKGENIYVTNLYLFRSLLLSLLLIKLCLNSVWIIHWHRHFVMSMNLSLSFSWVWCQSDDASYMNLNEHILQVLGIPFLSSCQIMISKVSKLNIFGTHWILEKLGDKTVIFKFPKLNYIFLTYFYF